VYLSNYYLAVLLPVVVLMEVLEIDSLTRDLSKKKAVIYYLDGLDFWEMDFWIFDNFQV
jgi:hypothetical protein